MPAADCTGADTLSVMQEPQTIMSTADMPTSATDNAVGDAAVMAAVPDAAAADAIYGFPLLLGSKSVSEGGVTHSMIPESAGPSRVASNSIAEPAAATPCRPQFSLEWLRTLPDDEAQQFLMNLGAPPCLDENTFKLQCLY